MTGQRLQAENEKRFSAQELVDFGTSVLSRLSVPDAEGRETMNCLVYADLRGVASHGVIRLPVYARRLRVGAINPQPNVQIEPAGPVAIRVDGDNGLGPVVGKRAISEAISLAEKQGIAFVGAYHSNHFGAAGYYVEQAVDAGYLAITSSNAPPNMAPWGGKERFLGTNPLAIGIPAGKQAPLILDMATSVVARGKIILAAETGQSIPEGWAIDPEGRPTTDANAALKGAVLPFGGPKGSALSLILDILCGVLTGASFAYHLNTLEDLENQQNLGHVFIVIKPDLFQTRQSFLDRMDDILGALKASPCVPGVDRVMAPGEPERATAQHYQTNGIPVAMDVVRQLEDLGREVGVTLS